MRRKTSKEELGVIDKQQVGIVRMGEEQVVLFYYFSAVCLLIGQNLNDDS